MSDSEVDDIDEFLDLYSSSNTKSFFNSQIAILKNSKPIIEKPTTESNTNIVVKPNFKETTVVESTAKAQDVLQICDDNVLGVSEVSLTIPNKTSHQDDAVMSIKEPTEVINLCENNDIIEVIEAPVKRYNTRASRKRFDNSASEEPVVVSITNSTKKKSTKLAKKQIKYDNEPEDDENYETNVKILWKSVNVVRVPVRRLQKLNIVFEHLMKENNLPMDQILLTFKGVAIRPTDTPDSLNLNVCDFLEGGILSTGHQTHSKTQGDSGFQIKFQDVNKQITVLPVKKDEKIKIALMKYAEQVEKPLEKIKFMFDGFPVHFSKSPMVMDIENGDVIDVIYL